METQLRQEIIQKLIGKISNSKEDIINLILRIRDIPYGTVGSRLPEDVYKNNKGTCSGKHALLKELLIELNIQVKEMIAIHKFNNLKINFPDNLQSILNNNEIIDPHNFLRVKIDDKWLNVDITWDKPLHKLGFEINETWNGEADMKLCVISNDISEPKDITKFKEEFINKLTPEQQKTRKTFIEQLSIWLDSERLN
jgi:hypothetical protein